MPTAPLPRPGDVLLLDDHASVQFARGRAILLRLIRVSDRVTTVGWVWLEGYETTAQGVAVRHREVFVQVDGLRRVELVADRVPGGPRPRPLNAGAFGGGRAVRRVAAG